MNKCTYFVKKTDGLQLYAAAIRRIFHTVEIEGRRLANIRAILSPIPLTVTTSVYM